MAGKPHFVNTFFADEERLSAECCILRAAGPLRPLQPEGGNWSADYYQGICPVCGAGWNQIAPFHLRREPKLGRNSFASFWSSAFELFVRQEVLDGFQAEGMRGVDSWPVVVGKDKHPAGAMRQLLVKNVAEPALADGLAEREQYRNEICLRCGREWHIYYKRGMLSLRRSALRSDVDLQMTHEWFGSGRAARHEILVSRRVVQLILNKKWKGADLSPIQAV
jgi:hypothetical protein